MTRIPFRTSCVIESGFHELDDAQRDHLRNDIHWHASGLTSDEERLLAHYTSSAGVTAEAAVLCYERDGRLYHLSQQESLTAAHLRLIFNRLLRDGVPFADDDDDDDDDETPMIDDNPDLAW